MKKLILFFSIALCLLTISTPAQAQLKFGIKAGTSFSRLSFDSDLYKSNNHLGFTGGVMAEFMIPVLGIGVDGSVLYTRKDVREGSGFIQSYDKKLDYLDIPVNFKWKFGVPLFKFFLTAGPNFGFMLSDMKDVKNMVETGDRKFDLGINLGGGIEFFNHVQIAVAHNWGLSQRFEIIESEHNRAKAKMRSWSLTAAYLF